MQSQERQHHQTVTSLLAILRSENIVTSSSSSSEEVFFESITESCGNKHVLKAGPAQEDRTINNKFEYKTEGRREYVFTHWRLKPPRHFHCSVIAVTTRLLCTGSGPRGATPMHSPLEPNPRRAKLQIRVQCCSKFKNTVFHYVIYLLRFGAINHSVT